MAFGRIIAPAILSTHVCYISRWMTQATHTCPLPGNRYLLPPITAPHSPSHPNLSQPLSSRPSIREHGLCGRVSGFEAWTHVHKGRGGREIIASQYTDSDTGICSNLCWGISPNDALCWLSCLQISGWTNYRSTWAGHCFVSFTTKSEKTLSFCQSEKTLSFTATIFYQVQETLS